VHVQFVLVMYAPSFRLFVSEIDIRWSAAYENAAATNAALSKAEPVTANPRNRTQIV
jgi:hypothetical protein